VHHGVQELMLGALVTDGVHADGRTEFFRRLSALMEMQEGHIRVTAPAATLTAVELIRHSGVPPEILAWAHSCHTAAEACGDCRGCRKHFLTRKDLGWEPR